jgi:PAB-dependent poly(A)-specific ribonuclease subunit 2
MLAQGRVTSFYGPELQKYTSYRGHVSRDQRTSSNNVPVKQLLFCDRGVISVSHESVHLSSRRGLAQWHISLPDMENLRCMSFTGKGTDEIVVAGCQKQLYRIDVEKGTVTETLTPATPVPYTMMKRAGNCICAAAHDGSIYLLDLRTLAVLHSWKAYAGSINDMDARGDYLLTCGWAPRHYQGLALEQLVRVYDLKIQKPAPPISFPPGAAFVRMHPKLSTTCTVLSQAGAIYSIDILNPDVPIMRFAQTFDAQLRGLDVMPSGKGFAMADSHCQLVLWGSTTKMQFLEYGRPTEFADHQLPARQLDWSPDTALNLIGMPYYRDMLLSVWSSSMVHEVGAPPPKIDPTLLASLQKFQTGMMTGEVGPNPKKTRRYQKEDTRTLQKSRRPLAPPKFLSEKPRDEVPEQDGQRRMSEDVAKTFAELTVSNNASSHVPVWYQAVEIKYSKFGIEDFDFGYYNYTKYSGLETHIVNSYANALLQLYRFTPVVRNLALDHTARDCGYENCMLCELGFLIDMLEKAKGKSCQASNFLKTLSKLSSASALAVLEEHTVNTPLSVMIQNLNRFLLNTMEENNRLISANPEEMQYSFGTTGYALSQCGHCNYEASQPKISYCHDLVYPPKLPKQSPRPMRQYFSQVLKASIERCDIQRGWCSRCQGYKPITSRRVVHTVPAVLTLNTAIHTAEAKQLWAAPGFLPKEVGIIVKDGLLYCYEGQDLRTHLQRRAFDITVYELVGTVADITLGDSKKSHIVSTIDTSLSEPDVQHSEDWHLFNDFMVRKVGAEDGLGFDARWKLPAVVTYQIKAMSHDIDNSWKSKIDTRVLYRSVAQPGLTTPTDFRAFNSTDILPSAGTHCAIDAEFVRLLREEIDVGADGARTITRPHRSGLARVSVLRGDEPERGVPFIDDYISIDDPIEDYLTEYSGLRPGDLTLGASRYVLVSLKAVYKKLWVLLNLGCKFIGHGLKSDFRTINIHVPESQVIDTQELFSLGSRARRKLSLRFLAWLLLREDIQSSGPEAGHNSIEDAATALKLWRKYLEFVDAGILEDMIDEIWIKGKACDFKVPAERFGKSAAGVESAPGTPRRKLSGGSRVGTPGTGVSVGGSGLNGARELFGSPLR